MALAEQRRNVNRSSGFASKSRYAITDEGDYYKVLVDVKDFKDGDVKVIVLDEEELKIEGSMTVLKGGGSKSFTQPITMPGAIKVDGVTSEMSSEGILEIIAPKYIKNKKAMNGNSQDVNSSDQAKKSDMFDKQELNITGDETNHKIVINLSECKDLQLFAVDEDTVSIEGRCANMNFARRVRVPTPFRADKITSSLSEDGILTIIAPKALSYHTYHGTKQIHINKTYDASQQENRRHSESRTISVHKSHQDAKVVTSLNTSEAVKKNDTLNKQEISFSGDDEVQRIVIDMNGCNHIKLFAVDEDTITVEGKSGNTSFTRRVRVPIPFIADRVTSTITKDGTLTIIAPKATSHHRHHGTMRVPVNGTYDTYDGHTEVSETETTNVSVSKNYSHNQASHHQESTKTTYSPEDIKKENTLAKQELRMLGDEETHKVVINMSECKELQLFACDEDTITIEGKSGNKTFTRRIRVPTPFIASRITSSIDEDGMLTIVAPKATSQHRHHGTTRVPLTRTYENRSESNETETRNVSVSKSYKHDEAKHHQESAKETYSSDQTRKDEVFAKQEMRISGDETTHKVMINMSDCKDLQLFACDEDTITIEGKSGNMSFTRRVRVPTPFRADKITSTFSKDGILTIIAPKATSQHRHHGTVRIPLTNTYELHSESNESHTETTTVSTAKSDQQKKDEIFAKQEISISGDDSTHKITINMKGCKDLQLYAVDEDTITIEGKIGNMTFTRRIRVPTPFIAPKISSHLDDNDLLTITAPIATSYHRHHGTVSIPMTKGYLPQPKVKPEETRSVKKTPAARKNKDHVTFSPF